MYGHADRPAGMTYSLRHAHAHAHTSHCRPTNLNTHDLLPVRLQPLVQHVNDGSGFLISDRSGSLALRRLHDQLRRNDPLLHIALLGGLFDQRSAGGIGDSDVGACLTLFLGLRAALALLLLRFRHRGRGRGSGDHARRYGNGCIRHFGVSDDQVFSLGAGKLLGGVGHSSGGCAGNKGRNLGFGR